MKEFIEALQILLKYKQEDKYVFAAEHDVIYLTGFEQCEISETDLRRLSELGFNRHDIEDDDFKPNSDWEGSFYYLI